MFDLVVKHSTSQVGAPTWRLWLPIPAFCSCRLWEAVVMAQVTGLLTTIWRSTLNSGSQLWPSGHGRHLESKSMVLSNNVSVYMEKKIDKYFGCKKNLKCMSGIFILTFPGISWWSLMYSIKSPQSSSFAHFMSSARSFPVSPLTLWRQSHTIDFVSVCSYSQPIPYLTSRVWQVPRLMVWRLKTPWAPWICDHLFHARCFSSPL